MSELVAFLDESRRPVRHRATGKVIDHRHQVYVVAAAVTVSADLDEVRTELVALAAEVGTDIHFRDMTRSRRARFFEQFGERLGGAVEVHLAETDGASRSNEHVARDRLLSALLPQLADHGVGRAVLETRDQPDGRFTGLDARDFATASVLVEDGFAVPAIEHGTKEEPLLGLPDLFAGARSLHLCRGDSAPWFAIQEHVVASGPIRIRA